MSSDEDLRAAERRGAERLRDMLIREAEVESARLVQKAFDNESSPVFHELASRERIRALTWAEVALYLRSLDVSVAAEMTTADIEPEVELKHYVCVNCRDTHRVDVPEGCEGPANGKWMCTSCPTPCIECGKGGPFCQSTPCRCHCHAKQWQYINFYQKTGSP